MPGRRGGKEPIRFGELVRPPLGRRRWLQLGLGILLLIATIVAVQIAWLDYNRRSIRQRRATLKEPGVQPTDSKSAHVTSGEAR